MQYTWETLEIEKLTEEKLCALLGESNGKSRFGKYTIAREKLITDVLPAIARILPGHTDHGPEHVKQVLNHAFDLLGEETNQLNGVELYFLIMSILFHDAGNFFGREKHREQISSIYDNACPTQLGAQDAEEKKIILNICEAHCGESIDGTNNTLKYVVEQTIIDRQNVRPNVLAPILRLADELAEGECRSCYSMIKYKILKKPSMIFHKYSNCSKISIDRAGKRIQLTYHIKLKLPKDNKPENGNGTIISIADLQPLLDFIYLRIEKLNQERQYTKHYCSLLDPYIKTTITISFWYKNHELPIDDLQKVEMSDLVVPGDFQKEFTKYNRNYEPKKVVSLLSKSIKEFNQQHRD